MDFYSDINNAVFNEQLITARKKEKHALFINASKLGALLIIYHLLGTLMVNVYYYIVYAYKNHSFTLSYTTVIKYLRGQPELISSSLFVMLANLFSVVLSLVITLMTAGLLMKVRFGVMIKPQKKHFIGAGVWLPACMAINSVMSVIAAIFTMFMGKRGITVPEMDLTLSDPGFAGLFTQIVYVIIIGPIAEELIYRGMILSLLKPFGKWLAVFFSALMFALMHGNIPQALAAFMGALVYGLLAVKFDSIIPTILIHIANNFIASYPDYKAVYNLPMWIYYAVMIVLSFAGIYVILTRITELRIKHESPSVLSSVQKYRIVFTNVFVIFYLLMLITTFINAFYYANM